MIFCSYIFPNRRLSSSLKQSSSALWASSDLMFHLKDLFQEHSYFDSLVSFVKQYRRHLFKRCCNGENNSIWEILGVELTVCTEEAFEQNCIANFAFFFITVINGNSCYPVFKVIILPTFIKSVQQELRLHVCIKVRRPLADSFL